MKLIRFAAVAIAIVAGVLTALPVSTAAAKARAGCRDTAAKARAGGANSAAEARSGRNCAAAAEARSCRGNAAAESATAAKRGGRGAAAARGIATWAAAVLGESFAGHRQRQSERHECSGTQNLQSDHLFGSISGTWSNPANGRTFPSLAPVVRNRQPDSAELYAA